MDKNYEFLCKNYIHYLNFMFRHDTETKMLASEVCYRYFILLFSAMILLNFLNTSMYLSAVCSKFKFLGVLVIL